MKTKAADEIAWRRLAGQRLVGEPFRDAAETVRWFGAVQAQDFAGAKWAIGQRTKDATDERVEAAFNAGKILRTHVLRPTWHFVTPEDLRWMVTLTAPRVKAAMAFNDRAHGLTEKIFSRSQALMTAALQGGKFLTRDELAEILARGKVRASGVALAHLMMRAELELVVCSGPRRGKQFTYALVDERAPAAREPSRAESLVEMARRYFASHGPATLQDFAWWSGLTLADAKAAARDAKLAEEKIGGRSLWSVEPIAAAKARGPAVHLLPNYDEFVVGLRDKTDVCTAEIEAKFGRAANGTGWLLGNVIVVDGMIAGEWRRTLGNKHVRVDVRPMRRLSATEAAGLRRAAEGFGKFLDVPVDVG